MISELVEPTASREADCIAIDGTFQGHVRAGRRFLEVEGGLQNTLPASLAIALVRGLAAGATSPEEVSCSYGLADLCKLLAEEFPEAESKLGISLRGE